MGEGRPDWAANMNIPDHLWEAHLKVSDELTRAYRKPSCRCVLVVADEEQELISRIQEKLHGTE